MKDSSKKDRPIMAPAFTGVTRLGKAYTILCHTMDMRVATFNDNGSYFCPRCWEYRDLIDWRKETDGGEQVVIPWR